MEAAKASNLSSITGRQDHVEVEFSGRTVVVESTRVAQALLTRSGWRVRGKYLVRSQRVGKHCITQYAHKILFPNTVPINGNYLDLRTENFADQKELPESPKRTHEEIAPFIEALGANWKNFYAHGLRRLHDITKTTDALGTTVDRVIAELERGRSFPTLQHFIGYTYAILNGQIKLRLSTPGDIVREPGEVIRRVGKLDGDPSNVREEM